MRKIAIILFLAATLRIYGMNWDSGFHLHPDERMIIMVADSVHLFDRMNPHFFNYGSLPIYLLKGISQLIDTVFFTHIATYQGMLSVGRWLSVVFDVGTIFLIYTIAHALFKKERIALFSSFLYTIAFFPIQNAHFFTADILFTFLTTLLLYLLILYSKKQSLKNIFFLGIVFGALFATKFTAIIFFPVIASIILVTKKFSRHLIRDMLCFLLTSLLFYFLFMPYAFLSYARFFSDISLQLKMNSDPYIFPYTLQYVSTTPYWYYLKNMFLWGLGPFLSSLSIIGLISIRKKFQIFFLFYLLYFAAIGMSSVKFMRYMLPIYPFLAIMAGYGLFRIQGLAQKVLLLLAIFWTAMFINIYSQPNPRISATEWILKNIPSGSTLAVEHWDDYLPMYGGENYNFNELHLYDLPDNTLKWDRLNNKIQRSDFLIIASNRLYVPLQKLAGCPHVRGCYPKTADYYKQLFSGRLGFKKIVEFTNYPKLEIGGYRLEIRDDSADESFTVYDHPKVMIFQRS